MSTAAPQALPSDCTYGDDSHPSLLRATMVAGLLARSCEAAKADGRGWDRTSDPYDVNVEPMAKFLAKWV